MRGVAGSTPGCGTVARYNQGCSCERCRNANLLRNKALKLCHARGQALLIPRHGTIRRIQALRAIGWDRKALAARLGCTPQAVSDLCTDPTRPVHVNTATRITRLYDTLSMTPGPSAAARAHAQRMGWAPPLAWDDDAIDDPNGAPVSADDTSSDGLVDEAAVLRRITGDHRIDLNRAERLEAVIRLHARGLSDPDIAQRLGYSERSILRYRGELGLPSNPTVHNNARRVA